MAARETIYSVENIYAGYGEIEVLKGISIDVRRGEIMSIIGANGAGKSTLLKTLFGIVKVNQGEIYFEGHPITNWPPASVLKKGVTYVPQGRTNFPAMTIQENLEMGAFIRDDKEAVAADIDELCRRFPVLAEKRQEQAGNLSGGQQQILEMAMALVLHPKVILIDEPTLGLSPLLVGNVFAAIRQINAEGTTIVMVEQNAKRALEISHHAVVLDLGTRRFEGTGEEIFHNPDVRAHYLGL